MSFLSRREIRTITDSSIPFEQAEILRSRYGIYPFINDKGIPFVLKEAAIKAQLTPPSESNVIIDLEAING